MSGDSKRSDRQPFQELLIEMPPAGEVPAKERAQIAQLIANGKFGFALDVAKQVHKRCNNAVHPRKKLRKPAADYAEPLRTTAAWAWS